MCSRETMLATAAALVLAACWSLGAHGAEPSGGEPPSRALAVDGQAQSETPRIEAYGEAMPGAESAPATADADDRKTRRARSRSRARVATPATELGAMEKQLAAQVPVRAVPGGGADGEDLQAEDAPAEDMPPLPREGTRLAHAGGDQIAARAEVARASGESHLVLVLEVRADGGSEVVSATELPGPAPISDEPRGDFLYAVTRGGRTVAVEALPDPFEAHAFGGPPGTPQEKHLFFAQPEATIVVRVPTERTRGPLTDLGVELLELESGAPLERVTPEVLYELKRDDRVRTLMRSEGAELAPQIQSRMLTAPDAALEVRP